MENWVNFGDVNPFEGQVWINESQYYSDCADVVQVISGNDLGQPSNTVLIDSGSIYFSPDNWDSALDCCGNDIIGPPTFLDVAYAFFGYQGFDSNYYGGGYWLMVGKPCPKYDPELTVDIDVCLHGNTNLRNWIDPNYLY